MKNKPGLRVGDLIVDITQDKTKWRDHMEDFSFVNQISLPNLNAPDNIVCILGVCDGHGGMAVSKYVSSQMKKIIAQGLSPICHPSQFLNGSFMRKILRNCFAILEIQLEHDLPKEEAGSTCAMVLYVPSLKLFYVLNCGDSSVFGITKTGLLRLSTLHKPDDSTELNRIRMHSGFVTNLDKSENIGGSDVPRLCGVLAVSRGFGDYNFIKYGLTAFPDVFGPYELADSSNIDNKYIGFLITSDGITDFISEKDMQSQLAENFDQRFKYATILRQNTNSMDNVTALSAFIV